VISPCPRPLQAIYHPWIRIRFRNADPDLATKKKIRAENRNFYDWRIFKYIFYEKFCYFWRNFVSCIPRSSFATKNNNENFRDHPTIIGLHYQKNIYKNILIQRNFKESLKKFEFKYILHDILLF
jgi:hypothetical protein